MAFFAKNEAVKNGKLPILVSPQADLNTVFHSSFIAHFYPVFFTAHHFHKI
jgi:hypothetical protein